MTRGIYRIDHVASGRTYVGQSINIERRWEAHINRLRGSYHGNALMQALFDRDGLSAFRFSIVEEVAEGDLDGPELHWMEALLAHVDVGGMNLSRLPGAPMAGFRHTDEARAAISEAQSGMKRGKPSEATKAKIKARRDELIASGWTHPFEGQTQSDAAKKKMSEAARKRYEDGWTAPFKGRKHTEAAKRKMREAKAARKAEKDKAR